MATNTTAVAKQVRLQQWAQQITDCQNRPVGMKVIDWCDANGIILPINIVIKIFLYKLYIIYYDNQKDIFRAG